jgi:hypothetical protein
MSNPIETLVQRWGDNELSVTRLRIVNREKWLYRSYEPNKFGVGDFEQRLVHWLDNVSSDDDKKTLFRLLVELFYVGPVEFEELYRVAYQGPVARWLIDVEGIDICAPNAQTQLVAAARQTWFCPVTDSFRINAFFHINNLSAGGSLRPDWRSLHALGDVAKINNYCKAEGIKRLVLLEDFVGGGSQSLGAVQFAALSLPDVKVLFVPLIICPDGAKRARAIARVANAARPGVLRYEAAVELPANAFLTRKQSPFTANDPFLPRVRDLIDRTYARVSGGAPPGDKPYDPYGYPANKPTGGLLVMYSNTPDNTLPLVHWQPRGGGWVPIFPRHSRD